MLIGLVSHCAQVGATLQLWLLSSCDYPSFRGFSLQWFLSLWSMWAHGLRSCSSQALEPRLSSVACGLSCSTWCGIFLGQGSNLCPLHWQVNSLPLSHQGSPNVSYFEHTLHSFTVLLDLTNNFILMKNKSRTVNPHCLPSSLLFSHKVESDSLQPHGL